MKQLHVHEAHQPTMGFISMHVIFYAVSACASKLHERIGVMVYMHASFLGGVFLGTTRFLAIR